ncbi:hypothetical protein [Haloarcula marina]|uniref:hypothetical protein n=1 Tax=Haloarcula marina TaxID=2961574 RepID=UPI0020B654FF|nr:hypothetical protein [Halomicroarcula marina]
MESPSERWPKAIFDTDILNKLEEDFDSCKHDILEYVEHQYQNGTAPGITPEFAACTIGEMAYRQHKEEDYFLKVIQNIDGDEAKRLAKGYIGIQAIKEADC